MGQTDGWTTDKWTDRQMGRQTYMDRHGQTWTDRQTYGQTDRQTNGQTWTDMDRHGQTADRQTDRWTDRQMDRQTDRWTYRQMDRQKDLYIIKTKPAVAYQSRQ